MEYITSFEELEKYLKLTPQEKAWHEETTCVPLKITGYYMALINPEDPCDPLRRQAVPTVSENKDVFMESSDPLAEVSHSPAQRLIHRYGNRVAFLATDICAQYCRHCFRRRFTGNMTGPASDGDVEFACEYLKTHREVREMLFTGGDPLTLSDEHIDRIIGEFRKVSPELVIRICTRFPAVQPDRITDSLVNIFKKYSTAPFYLMTQFNHPRELTAQAIEAVSRFVDRGIPAMNQTVLLRAVNDNADVLEELCNALVFARIKPYYLFQGDLVSGTSGFRVPLAKGLEIEKELRKRLSGLAMPLYAADLPEGGGKVPLCGNYIEGCENGVWKFTTLHGTSRLYPDPQA